MTSLLLSQPNFTKEGKLSNTTCQPTHSNSIPALHQFGFLSRHSLKPLQARLLTTSEPLKPQESFQDKSYLDAVRLWTSLPNLSLLTLWWSHSEFFSGFSHHSSLDDFSYCMYCTPLLAFKWVRSMGYPLLIPTYMVSSSPTN